MTESDAPASAPRRPTIPNAVGIPIVVVLVLLFIAILFPWDSLARRIAWEVSAASGSRVTIRDLSPALTARGPVLRARDVLVEHPAVERLRLRELEIAPRFSTSWLSGEPRLRIHADTDLGLVDGVIELGQASTFAGDVRDVVLERLPLRLDETGVRLAGRVDATTDIAFDRNGTLSGRVEFASPSLVFESDTLPMPIPFSRADGVVVIRDDGATQIESLELEGDVVAGRLSGEIGIGRRGQSPPIDLRAELRVVDPTLRRLAPGTGLPVSPNGDLAAHVLGTVDAPVLQPLQAAGPRPSPARARRTR